jgi:hypothetical protein
MTTATYDPYDDQEQPGPYAKTPHALPGRIGTPRGGLSLVQEPNDGSRSRALCFPKGWVELQLA